MAEELPVRRVEVSFVGTAAGAAWQRGDPRPDLASAAVRL